MQVELPYGRRPLVVDVGDRAVDVVRPPISEPPREPLAARLDAALEHVAVPAGVRRATVIVSDATRIEPRGEMVAAVRRWLGSTVAVQLAVATGTHGPADLSKLGLPADLPVINHDGHAPVDLVELGTTSRGTPVRVHRSVVETDLVVATGCIRPHYFAGFGAGCKAVFPGLGEATAVRVNHRLKTATGAQAGIVDGNPCREDLEEAVALLPCPIVLVNGVCDVDGVVHEVVAGDVRAAFREGVARARPRFTVQARRAPVVVASDCVPVAASLYQAAKIAAAVAGLVEPGGTLVVAAECFEGIEPLEVVNEAVWRIGVLPRLAPGVRLVLVSGVPESDVRRTLLEPASNIEPFFSDRMLFIPRASQLLYDA